MAGGVAGAGRGGCGGWEKKERSGGMCLWADGAAILLLQQLEGPELGCAAGGEGAGVDGKAEGEARGKDGVPERGKEKETP